MGNTGHIEINISGSKGNIKLSPDNFDIKEIIPILENVENLLFPKEKKSRPLVSYDIQEGSVKHVFRTTLQYIIGFNAIIGQINNSQNIDFLDAETAKAFENFQASAIKKDYVFHIKTSLPTSNAIYITKETNLIRTEAIWTDAEFYFYGKITNAGGKDRANIHIVTDDLGTIRVQTPISFLEKYEENMLYKNLGIRAKGKQQSETGEIDTSSLDFIELIDYEPKYDEKYLKTLRDRAKKNWLGKTNPEIWLLQVREGYEV